MFNNNPFGHSNNCGPFGGAPSNCSPFNGFGGYNNCSPANGWNSGSFGGYGGFNGPSFDCNYNNGFGGFGFPGYNFNNGYSANWNMPFNGFNNWNWNGAGFGGQGYNNWNSMPFNGYNSWSQFGANGQYANPMSCNIPFGGAHQSVGFPGMNWSSAWTGYNSPWMNWNSYFPGNYANQLAGGSPVSGVSNWFSSPWMGYAYPGFTQNNGVSNGKVNAPVNGQYIPSAGFPFPCAPFNVPFPANGYVPAGQGVNCEAA